MLGGVGYVRGEVRGGGAGLLLSLLLSGAAALARVCVRVLT